MTIFFYRFAPDVFDFCNAKLVEKSTNALVENIWKPCTLSAVNGTSHQISKLLLNPGGRSSFCASPLKSKSHYNDDKGAATALFLHALPKQTRNRKPRSNKTSSGMKEGKVRFHDRSRIERPQANKRLTFEVTM